MSAFAVCRPWTERSKQAEGLLNGLKVTSAAVQYSGARVSPYLELLEQQLVFIRLLEYQNSQINTEVTLGQLNVAFKAFEKAAGALYRSFLTTSVTDSMQSFVQEVNSGVLQSFPSLCPCDGASLPPSKLPGPRVRSGCRVSRNVPLVFQRSGPPAAAPAPAPAPVPPQPKDEEEEEEDDGIYLVSSAEEVQRFRDRVLRDTVP
jgi:hypothetical protein